MLDGEICAAEIDGIGTIPELRRHLPYWVAVGLIGYACVGTKNVDRTFMSLQCLRKRVFDGLFIADVALYAIEIWVSI